MAKRVLVLGANGFIGSRIAAALSAAGWQVRAGARDPLRSRRRAPHYEWIKADFHDLTRAQDWGPLLAGVDVVVNCVGVLQDGGRDSNHIAHVDGPRALIAACETAGMKRLIHISAVGADADAGTLYASSKAETENMVAASGLDWVILRPSLVVDRAAFGGTGFIRALSAMPLIIPVVGGDQPFKPVALADLADAVVRLSEDNAISREKMDITGPQTVTMTQTVQLYRGWLGFAAAPVVRVPRWVAAPAIVVGDMLGRIGWPSPLRTTSIKQLDYGAAGEDSDWGTRLGLEPRSFTRFLSENPASVQDVWHARLWAVRPVSILTLGLFWFLTGVVSYTAGWEASLAIIRESAAAQWAWPIVWFGALLDVALGLALFVRAWTARVAILMFMATVGYLVAATVLLPNYWVNPLGPWLKVLPMMALCLFVAATDERR
ncbi:MULTISPECIES: SDR family oxidoreductase [unclassified Brevundimonas]|uniref:SDR family oxidoreductase n=1 Tax=unclassified Brevundimonas TaxID=2622653 RepID=UPI0025BB2014|nr:MULTISPECIES: SDR family oxidoreductase [unclassified Brevundimonas]